MKKSEMKPEEKRQLIRKIVARFAGLPLVLATIVLLPAGTFNYWEFYVYTGIVVIPMLFVLSYFLKRDPRFLDRRTRAREKEKTQVIVQVIFTIVFLVGFVVSGLDRRFGWSEVPVNIVLLADLVILLGYLIIFRVFRENSYASRIVEVEEHQDLITTGLYSLVRHPMYVGVLIMYVPTPIALGSWWGVIPMMMIPLALVLRIRNEEALLKRQFPEYAEYCRNTKYRLIPYLW
ncbi:MAG: isoprenylcysteine carboxylmethyltransferase family protein [Bacteroides sp.]|nr:isoprenylcysteine carboxylmethyltransferase family protein [Bacteroides sp.]